MSEQLARRDRGLFLPQYLMGVQVEQALGACSTATAVTFDSEASR
jgi:hypothetical protein